MPKEKSPVLSRVWVFRPICFFRWPSADLFLAYPHCLHGNV